MSASASGRDMAFPCDPVHTPNNTIQVGLTKRELFTAMAMQGTLASPNTVCASGTAIPDFVKAIAVLSVSMADALLVALSDEVKS